MTVNGYEIDFTRRRYGKVTFVWIYVRIGGKWQPTGDPLQKMTSEKRLNAPGGIKLRRAAKGRKIVARVSRSGF